MRWSSSSDPAEASTIGRPQARAQQLLPGEDVERQAAIVSVVAVGKAPFLVAVQPVVGGVEIEHDALGLARLRLNVEIGQQTVHRTRVENDLLVTALRVGVGRGSLEAVESALAGTGVAAVLGSAALLAFEVLFATQQGQQRVGPQLIVIVEILITQHQPVDALGDQFSHAVFDLPGLPMIPEAAGELPQDAGALLGLAQQHAAAVGGDRAAVETGHHLAAALIGKREAGLGTLCHGEGRFLAG